MEHLLDEILDKRIIAIARGISRADALPVANALAKGGVCLMELPFKPDNVFAMEDALHGICTIAACDDLGMIVGAGTVLSVEQAERACDAGARFIVSPNVNVSVIRRTKELGMISIPGALTPTEIETAWEAGADIVKEFPAGAVGPSYFSAVKVSLSQVCLAAVGGVTEQNLASFFSTGAVVAGIGGNLVSKAQAAHADWDGICALAQRYSSIAAACKA